MNVRGILDFRAIAVAAVVGSVAWLALLALAWLFPALFGEVWIIVGHGYRFGTFIATGVIAGRLAKHHGSLHGLLAGLIVGVLSYGSTAVALGGFDRSFLEDTLDYLRAGAPWDAAGLTLAALAGSFAAWLARTRGTR